MLLTKLAGNKEWVMGILLASLPKLDFVINLKLLEKS
jgi:hypothetical protein